MTNKHPADRVLAPPKTVNLDEVDCVAESFDVLRRRTRVAFPDRPLPFYRRSGVDVILVDDRRDRTRRAVLAHTRDLIHSSHIITNLVVELAARATEVRISRYCSGMSGRTNIPS